MDISRITALGRFIDMRYASNRFIVAAAGLGGIGTLVYLLATEGDDPWLWAFRVGGAMFLAWAIGRELDPDHSESAGLAAPIAGAAVAIAEPEIGAAAGFIVALRIVVRSTGMSAHPWELGGVVIFAGYLASSPGGWPGVIALVWALWIDGGHVHAPHPPSRVASIGAAGVAIVVAVVVFPDDLAFERGWGSTAVFLLGVVAAWLAVNRLAPPTSTGDYDRRPVSVDRVAQARILAGVALGTAAILTPLEPAAYAPLLAAIVATAGVTFREGAPSETR